MSSKFQVMSSKTRGFTIVEITIVIALFAGLATLGLMVGIDLYKGNALISERDTIASVIHRARSRSMENIRESSHGIYFNEDSYILFTGASYETRNAAYDEIIIKSAAVNVTGTREFAFEQLSGSALNNGDIIISDDTGKQFTISINEEGRVEW